MLEFDSIAAAIVMRYTGMDGIDIFFDFFRRNHLTQLRIG